MGLLDGVLIIRHMHSKGVNAREYIWSPLFVLAVVSGEGFEGEVHHISAMHLEGDTACPLQISR